MEKNEKSYQVIKEGDRYTIGQFDEDHDAFIINDGICKYYFWSTEEEAQEAANAYNSFDGLEWLGEHGNGNDTLDASEIEEFDPDMVELYQLFNAIYYPVPAQISLNNGRSFCTPEEALEKQGLDVIANMMDDETRERVHNEIAPCTDLEFLTRYLEIADNDLIIG